MFVPAAKSAIQSAGQICFAIAHATFFMLDSRYSVQSSEFQLTEFQLTLFQLTEFQFTLFQFTEFQFTLFQVTGSFPVHSSWLA